MAKNAQKTNALGMQLSPSSFKTVVEQEKIEKVNSVQETEIVEKPVVVEKVETAVKVEEKEAPVVVEAPTDILANLDTNKTVVKGYSFTLKEENVKKLKALAKKRGVSASKMLDHILSEVIK